MKREQNSLPIIFFVGDQVPHVEQSVYHQCDFFASTFRSPCYSILGKWLPPELEISDCMTWTNK